MHRASAGKAAALLIIRSLKNLLVPGNEPASCTLIMYVHTRARKFILLFLFNIKKEKKFQCYTLSKRKHPVFAYMRVRENALISKRPNLKK